MTTTPPTSAGDSRHQPVPASAVVNTAAPRRTWSRKRRNTTIAIGAVVAIAMVTCGAFGLTALGAQAQHNDALTNARTAVHALAVAEISNEAAKVDLDAAVTGTAQRSAELVPIVAAAPAYLDTATAAVLEQARAGLDAAIVQVKSADPDDASVAPATDTLPAMTVARILPKDATDTQLSTFTKNLATATGDVAGNTAVKRSAIDTLTAAEDPVHQALRDLGNRAVDTNAPAVRAFAPGVDQTAFNAAVSSLQGSIDDDDPMVPALNAYIVAAKTVLDAQTAINTQAAIDAANAAGNDTYVDPSTGESKPNPNYDSGSGSDGGGSSGGGSGSGGGGGSGGGSGAGSGGGTTDSGWRPLKVSPGGSSCQGAGGSQEVTYGSTLVPPADSVSYSTYEIPGYGWGVTWTCDTGW